LKLEIAAAPVEAMAISTKIKWYLTLVAPVLPDNVPLVWLSFGSYCTIAWALTTPLPGEIYTNVDKSASPTIVFVEVYLIPALKSNKLSANISAIVRILGPVEVPISDVDSAIGLEVLAPVTS
jgi:hypothetical protein